MGIFSRGLGIMSSKITSQNFRNRKAAGRTIDIQKRRAKILYIYIYIYNSQI
jgi:hypothetical protein